MCACVCAEVSGKFSQAQNRWWTASFLHRLFVAGGMARDVVDVSEQNEKKLRLSHIAPGVKSYP